MERSPEIEALVEAWFDAATKGDASLVAAHVSQSDGTRLIGSDPSEVFEGGAAVSAFLTGEVVGSGGRAKFTPTDTEAFREGSVAWATTHVTITMPDGGQGFSALECGVPPRGRDLAIRADPRLHRGAE